MIITNGTELLIQSSTYTFNTTAVNGCDSVATLDLTINNSSEIFNTVSSCDSYEWNGNIYDVSGICSYSTFTLNGCDSSATLDLTISYSDTSTQTITACDSYEWNGNIYTSEFIILKQLL